MASGTPSQKPTDASTDARVADAGLGMVTGLATALRNIVIYPASHPRVLATASELVANIAQRSQGKRPVIVGQRGDDLLADGEVVDSTGPQQQWLLQRFRDAALRGVVFEPTCTAADLVEFAIALNQARAKNGVALASLWPTDHPRLRPLDLVFTGSFRDAANSETTASDTAELTPTEHAALAAKQRQQQVLEQLNSDRGIRQHLVAIEMGLAAATPGGGEEIDMLAAVTELLPADIASQPDQVIECVKKVLHEVEAALPELTSRNTQIEGAELLRIAIGVARKYFHVEATGQPAKQNLPSGRPEDEGICADLPALLRELDALPDAGCLRLPPSDELQAASPTMACELFGIYLHTFIAAQGDEVRLAARQRLLSLMTGIDGNRRSVLAAYLGRPQQPAPHSETVRTQLLAMLVETGNTQLVRELGYVDATFISGSFPESLRIAAKTLKRTPDDLAILRDGLTALAPMMALGCGEAAAKAGVLKEPAVVDALLFLGGSCVLPLLPYVVTDAPPEVAGKLLAMLAKQRLPLPEAAALQVSAPPLAVPNQYLLDLLRAVMLGTFDAPLRAATGHLLRSHVNQGLEVLPHERLLTTISALRHVPSPATLVLLEQLATRRRSAVFDSKARAIRHCAREVLAGLSKTSKR